MSLQLRRRKMTGRKWLAACVSLWGKSYRVFRMWSPTEDLVCGLGEHATIRLMKAWNDKNIDGSRDI